MAVEHALRLIARAGLAVRISALVALTLVCTPSSAQQLQTGEISTQLSDGSLLVTGGINTAGQPTGEAYILSAGNRLPLINRLQEARTGHTATVMPDGKVLVHGGTVVGGAFARRSELIDPQTRTVSAVNSLELLPRAQHTTSVLTDGTVVVAGGVGPDGFPLFDVDLFNGFNRQQYPTRASLLASRFGHAAQLLPDGRLLISGGQDRVGAVTAAEALDALTHEFAPVSPAQLAALQLQNGKLAPAHLAGSIPVNDARDVDRGASVSLRFSNSVSVVASRAAKISLRTVAGPIPVTVTFAERGRLLFINPQRPLAGGEIHTLAVEGLVDDNGAALARIELKFTTALAATGGSLEVLTDTSKPPSSAPMSPPTSASSSASAAATSAGTARTPTKTDLGLVRKTVRLPLVFEMNVGQDHPDVKARTLGAGLGVFLTARSVVFKLPAERRASDPTSQLAAIQVARRSRALTAADSERAPPASDVLSMNFVGGKADPVVTPEEPLAGKTHYLRTDGKAAQRNVQHYGRIRYRDVYPGIDKVHYGVEGRLEHDWIVKPGADPSQIVAEFEGATSIELLPNGDMTVKAANSSLAVRKPYAYQVVAGKKREIAATFKVVGTNRVSFALGSYDKTRELVIDPVVEYLSYLAIDYGGGSPVLGMSAAADGSLFLLIASQGGFPNRRDLAPTGGVAPEPNRHVFVAKLNSAGNAFDYATTIVDHTFNYRAHGLAVDTSGRPTFVAFSPETDCLPADELKRSFEGQVTGYRCGRLVRLSADGSALDVFSRMPQGTTPSGSVNEPDVPPVTAIGQAGDIFVIAPFSHSAFQTPPPLPALQAPIVTTFDEGQGCAIYRFNPDGSGPAYSAYIRNCRVPSIAVDSGNSLHIAYSLFGTRIDAPVAPILPQRDGNDTWGRVARIDAAGASFVYNTDLVADVVVPEPTAGRYSYTPYGSAIDAAGNFNVVGSLVSRIDPAGNLIASLDPFAVVAPAPGCSYLPYPSAVPRPRFESIQFGPGGVGYLIGSTVWPEAGVCNPRSGWIVKLAAVPNQFQIADVKYFGASQALYDFTDSTVDATGGLYVSGYSFANPPAVGIPPRNPLPGQPYYSSGPFLAKFAETPQLVTTPNPSIANTAVTLRFEAPDPSWTGSVLFKRNGVTLSSATINAGVASIVRSDFAVGTYTISADYSGDGSHAATTVITQHVAQTNVFRTFVNLTSIPVYPDECQDITLRATIPSAAGTLTAPIIFRHEYRELGRVVPNASRVADLNIGRWPLPLGSWIFNAYYAGDALHSEGAIGTVGVQIQAQNNVATLTQPLNNARFSFPSTVPITVAYTHTCLIPTTVRLYANNVLVKEVPGTASPVNFDWTPAFEGTFVLRVTLIMPNGRQPSTANVTVRVINGTYSDVQTTFLHTDAAGSPVAATDAAGIRIWVQEYDPFGLRVNPQPAAANNRQWFHGKAQDTETGFSYFGARYYDTLIGRFMSVDPAGVKDDSIHSFNRYSFANNNPYRFTDPDGNSPVDLIFLAVDVAKLGYSIYRGEGTKDAVIDVGLSLLGVVSPIPGTGQVLKAGRVVSEARVAAKAADNVWDTFKAGEAAGKKVLRDSEGSSAAAIAASTSGPQAGSRVGQSKIRQELVDEAKGEYKCWRCGQTSLKPENMHVGHRNVPTSKGGNLSKENVCLEGAACNLSAGNRGSPSPGMSCAERGGCGAPYGRTD